MNYRIDDRLIKNVNKSLKSSFEKVTFYENNVLKGLKTPCIFLRIADTSIKRLLNDRLKFDFIVSATYVPERENFKKKFPTNIQDIQMKLLAALEKIDTDTGSLYASDVTCETNYDEFGLTINAMATYSITYHTVRDKNYMLKLVEEGSVKD